MDSLSRGIQGVRDDTSAILAILKQGVRTGGGTASYGMPLSPRAGRAGVERTRDSLGRFIATQTAVSKAINSAMRTQAAQVADEKRALESRQHSASRDGRGRFVGAGGAAAKAREKEDARDSRKDDEERRGLFSRLKDFLRDLKRPELHGVGDLDKVDPTVEASKEFGRIVGGPLKSVSSVGRAIIGRGFGGAKDKAIPWFRRIFNELRLTRSNANSFALTETRVLREIERKTGGGPGGGRSGGGFFGGLGGLLGKIPGVGLLGRMGGGLLGGLLGAGRGLLGGALKLGKFGLRRLPLLGGLFAGGSALASMFGPDDPNKTAAQNREDRFTGAGSGIGTIIGGALGTLLGPVGTVVGGIIGDKVGELVGQWLSTVDWSKVADTITGAWDSAVGMAKGVWTSITDGWDKVTAGISDTWKGAVDKFDAITKKFSDAWGSMLDGAKGFLKDKLGIDVDAVVSKVKTVAAPVVDAASAVGAKVSAGASAAWNGVKNGAAAAVDYGKSRVERMAAPIQASATALTDKLFPGYRRKFDFDGIKGGDALAKYGSYTGEEADTIKGLKQGGANTSANLQGGMPRDIQEKIIAQANAAGLDPKMMLEFASMESGGNANAISSTGAIGVYQFTGKTASSVGIKNRFDADQNIAGAMKLTSDNLAMLKKSGLPATPENLYMMHQLGPSAATEVIRGAQNGAKISDLSEATQNAVGLNYGKGSATAAEYLSKNAAALTARADSVVGGSAAGYLSTAPAAVSPVATVGTPAIPGAAAIPSATVPVPAAPAAAQVANIPQRLNSGDPIEVRVAQDRAVGQDLSDRRLAQIATGGISPG